MDPITAVGFAASILTFVQFSWSVVSGTYEVRNSAGGITEDKVHINTVIVDLEAVTNNLKCRSLGNSEHEKALRQLASKCSDLSKKLLKILDNLRVKGKVTTLKSLKVKLESLRKEKDIMAIEKRLSEYQSQILLRLNLMLR